MRIDEFEFRNKQGDEIEPTKDQLVVYIKSLHKEIKTLKKALKLACIELNKNIDDKCEYCEYKENNIDYGSCDCDEQFETDRTVNHFKTKAKEMMKSDKERI